MIEFLVIIALVVPLGFLAGMVMSEFRVEPCWHVRRVASLVLAVLRDLRGRPAPGSFVMRTSEFEIAAGLVSRIEKPESLRDGILWAGGKLSFREILPDGCLAVEYGPGGEVARAYPYVLDDSIDSARIVELPRERTHPWRRPAPQGSQQAVRRYQNGDLLVVYNYSGHPWKGGIARVGRDGCPLWVRDDYSHHWPVIFEQDGEELALVPGLSMEDGLDCRPGHNEVDHVVLLGSDGRVLQDIRLIDTVIESPWAGMLRQSTVPSDLLHLNYIDRIRDDGVSPGDYVVSMRGLSAFGIMEAKSGRLVRMVRGTFVMQHSVQHLGGSQFLMFDNHGADQRSGPSRVLLVDLRGEGSVEQTIWPQPGDNLKDEHFYSSIRGNLAISPDRDRVLVASSDQGWGFEVSLRTGKTLQVLRNLHDVSSLPNAPTGADRNAAYLVLKDLQYVQT